jgi:hypothetical protein
MKKAHVVGTALIILILIGLGYWYRVQRSFVYTKNHPVENNHSGIATGASGTGSASGITSTSVSGVASGTSVDIYIYGPNNGNVGVNPNNETAAVHLGMLVFSAKNVPVINGHWTTTISPALNSRAFYQVNVGHPISNISSTNVASWDLTMNGDNSDYDVLKVK